MPELNLQLSSCKGDQRQSSCQHIVLVVCGAVYITTTRLGSTAGFMTASSGNNHCCCCVLSSSHAVTQISHVSQSSPTLRRFMRQTTLIVPDWTHFATVIFINIVFRLHYCLHINLIYKCFFIFFKWHYLDGDATDIKGTESAVVQFFDFTGYKPHEVLPLKAWLDCSGWNSMNHH